MWRPYASLGVGRAEERGGRRRRRVLLRLRRHERARGAEHGGEDVEVLPPPHARGDVPPGPGAQGSVPFPWPGLPARGHGQGAVTESVIALQ